MHVVGLHPPDLFLGRALIQSHHLARDQGAPAKIGGGIDACHIRPAQGQRFSHKAPGAAQIQHFLALPIDMSAKPSQPAWYQIPQRANPANVIRPPAIRHLVMDRQIIAHRADPLIGLVEARHKAPPRDNVRNGCRSGRQIGVPSNAGQVGNRP